MKGDFIESQHMFLYLQLKEQMSTCRALNSTGLWRGSGQIAGVTARNVDGNFAC